ncbi:MAG: D-alanyl-D-alanine carboxypeptidase [Clostridia bacterium]|nr:D-alanyl-D-alanine carboxypeptidase [Clostridia bacterium]
MVKKIFSVIFCILLIFSISTTAYAYEPTGFDVDAKSALLVSLDTDEVIYSKNETAKVYPASITKIMTVTLMLESELFDPEGTVAMTESALKLISGTGSVVSWYKAGQQINQLDLVYLVLMSSCGDCAYLAAEYYGGTVNNFVNMMNAKAQELGLSGTHYSNPVGLHDENNYTTAKDTYVLTKYALKNEIFKEVCETSRYTIEATETERAHTLSTTNFLQDNTTNYYYMYAKGVKTGFTNEAGRCVVSTASYNGYNYMCLVFGCTANAGKRYEFIDSKNLYKWAFTTFEFKEIARSEEPICEMKVELSMETDFVPLYVEESFISVLPRDADESTISIVPKLSGESVDAPVKKGQKLGTADIIYAEKVIGTVNLVAGENISRSAILAIGRGIKNFFTSPYMIAVYIIIAIAIVMFAAAVYKLNKGRSKSRKVRYIPYEKDDRNEKH